MTVVKRGAAQCGETPEPRVTTPAADLAVRCRLDLMVERRDTPGLQYLHVSSDAGLFEYHAGLADVPNRRPVTERTTFNAYSVTKTLTATAILQLAEQGRVDLDRPIAHYLGHFPGSPSPTLRQTLLHRGGFPNPNPMAWVHLAAEHASFGDAAFVREVCAAHSKLKAAPGQRTRYSNVGYLLLGAVVAKVSAQRYTDYIEGQLIAPLGLAAGETLGFSIRDPSQHARGTLERWSAMNAVLGLLLDRERYTQGHADGWVQFRHHHVNGAAYGGLIANARGLARYAQALLGRGATFAPALRAQLLEPVPEPGGGESQHSLGWFVGKLRGEPYLAHAGGGAGYYCELRLYPRPARVSVLMLNRTGVRDARLLDTIDADFVAPPR